MSVYHEAFLSGRLHVSDYPEIPAHKGKPARISFKGVRAHLREVKRAEAEERNSRTPVEADSALASGQGSPCRAWSGGGVR